MSFINLLLEGLEDFRFYIEEDWSFWEDFIKLDDLETVYL